VTRHAGGTVVRKSIWRRLEERVFDWLRTPSKRAPSDKTHGWVLIFLPALLVLLTLGILIWTHASL
jgi:hypothetical protein